MSDGDERAAQSNSRADALASSARDLLSQVVRTTDANTGTLSPLGQRFFDRLRATLDLSSDAATASPEIARAIVETSLERVPMNLRGAPGAWATMVDAVAGKLYESEIARAQLDLLWMSLRATRQEAS